MTENRRSNGHARFHGIAKPRKRKTGYLYLRKAEPSWDWTRNIPRFDPSQNFWKALILVPIILSVILIPSYAYYSNVYLPSLPQPQKPDPFTTLWNGQSKQQVSISLDAHVKSANCNTANCAATITGQSAGDLLVVTAADFDESACPGGMTISDGQSLTWHEIGCVFSHSTFQFGEAIAWYATGVSSASDVITIHDATGTKAFSAQAYSGATSATGLQTDSGNNVGSSGTTTTTGFLSSDYVVDFVDATDNADVLGTTWTLSTYVTLIDTNAPVAGGWPNFAVGHGIGTAAGYADMWSTADANIGYQHLTFVLVPSGSGGGALNVLDVLSPPTSHGNVAGIFDDVQSFTIASPFQLTELSWYFNLSSSVGILTLVSQVYALSGTPGVNGVLTGLPLETSVPYTGPYQLGNPLTPVPMQFQNAPVLPAGSYMALVTNNSTIPGASSAQFSGNSTVQPLLEGLVPSKAGYNRMGDSPKYQGGGVWSGSFNLVTNFALIVQFTQPGTCIIGYKCFNTSIVNSNLATTPTATFPSVAITNASIDLSTCAGKACAFSEGITGFSTPYTGTEEWAWFLTQNDTVPVSQSYSPLQDPSIALLVIAVAQSPSTQPPPVMDYYVYMQRQAGQVLSIGKDDPYPVCPQTGTLFICQSFQNTAFNFLNLVLNYTGNGGPMSTSGESYLCIGGGSGSTTCLVGGANNVQISFANTFLNINYTQPWLNLQNNYYQGFWQNPLGSNIEAATGWGTSPTTASLQTNVISVYVPPTSPANPQTTESGFFGWVGRALGGAYNFVAGALSPIVAPALNFGNSLLSAFVSGLIQAGNLLIKGLAVLESLLVTALNLIGNFVGLGPIGTDVQAVINSFITFFTNGTFTGVLAYIGNVFTVMFNRVTVGLAWVAFAITTVLNIATWLINGVAEVVTIATKITLVVTGLFAVLLMLLWFMDLGDYGASGGLAWLNTTEWLILGTGIRFVTTIINFGIDIISGLISIIPKPFVQMHNIPGWMRVPGIETSAQPTFPDGHMQAIRDLNIFAISGWLLGFVFFVWFESTNLPGSIGAAVTGAQPNLTPLSTLLPVYYILLLLLGVSFLAFLPATLTNAIPQIFGDRQDMKEKGFSFSAGPAPSSGGFGVRLSRRTSGTGRFQGRVEAKRKEAQAKLMGAKQAEAAQKQQAEHAAQAKRQQEQSDQARRVQERLAREEKQRQAIAVRQASGNA